MRCFLFLLYFPLQLAFGQAPTEVVLKGRFSGCDSSPSKIWLSSFYGTALQPVDTVEVNKKGVFVFKVNIPPHAGYYRLSLSASNYTDIILKPGENPSIVFDSCQLKKWKSVSGSEENQVMLQSRLLSAKQKEKTNYYQQLQQTAGQNKHTYFGTTTLAYLPLENVLPDTFSTGETRYNFIKKHFFDRVDFSNSEIIYSTLLPNIYMRYLERYTEYSENGFKESVDMILGKAMANENVYSFSVDFLVNLFNSVGPDIILEYVAEKYYFKYSCGLESRLGPETIKKLSAYEKLTPGNKIADFSFGTVNNKTIHISEIYNTNKVTVVVFWASFCHFCEQRISEWKQLYETYHKKGLEMVFVSLDTDRKEWENAVNSNGLKGIHTCDLNGWDGPVAQMLNVNRTPYLYVIHQNGTILLKDPAFEQLQSTISNQLD